jgi:BioD-like phosphotransacetylase family protein
MAVLQIVSANERAGKTAIAAGLAKSFATQGRVRLIRTGAGEGAAADAISFAGYLFASTPGVAVDSAALSGFAENETVIVEADAGTTPISDAPTLVVVRTEASDADKALAATLGDRLVGTIATDVPAMAVEAVARDLTNAGMRPLAIVPEDLMLAAPSVGEIRDILKAQVLYDGENELEVVEDVLLSPVYSDPARPHFRRFASKAVLSPYNKTDFHLAAIDTQAACLVLTGGGAPSPYVVDRAQGEATTVLLAPHETPQTLTEMSEVWQRSRFRGERKAEAIHALLERRLDIPGLLRKL